MEPTVKSLSPAIRPGPCTLGKPQPLIANFFRFRDSDLLSIYKIAVDFTPAVSPQDFRFRQKLIIKIRQELYRRIGMFVFANTVLFTSQIQAGNEAEDFTLTTDFDGTDYEISFRPVGPSSSQKERTTFYNKFFNCVFGKLRLTMIARKFYRADQPIPLEGYNASVWPGFVKAVGNYMGGTFVNIDVSHRVIHNESVLDMINGLGRGNVRLQTERMIIGATVLTRYNNRPYRIDRVEWEMSPRDQFADANGDQQTFSNYYQTRWGVAIENMNQPLLACQMRNMTCYLVPELCLLTGITDQMRNNFNVMKGVANVTNRQPRDRIGECENLIRSMRQEPAAQQEITNWNIEISDRPVQLQGRVLDPVYSKIGNNHTFESMSRGADREVQNELYATQEIRTWGIFYMRNDQRNFEEFKRNLMPAIQTFRLRYSEPRGFPINSDQWPAWRDSLNSTLNPNVQAIICIIPDRNRRGTFYNELKHLLITEKPVPSQIILSSTIKKPQGLRSKVNKILIQIVAKVGQTPWVIDRMPLADGRTMVMGIDVFHKKGSYSILGCCSSIDRNFGKFVPMTVNQREGQEISEGYIQVVENAVRMFYQSNNETAPQRIIVYRDGVSDSQRAVVLNQEVAQFLQALERLRSRIQTMPSLTFIIVNKRINARFYTDRYENPPVGTLVDNTVVTPEAYDFYLCPTNTRIGTVTPTHFHIIYDDSGISHNEIYDLTNKLCYGYYNWNGSVRVPASCKFAHKLASLNGQISGDTAVNPHNMWRGSDKLYFL